MKHEMRVMLNQRSGNIVNVSSTYGRTGAAGASIYAASKHAVEGLTKSTGQDGTMIPSRNGGLTGGRIVCPSTHPC